MNHFISLSEAVDMTARYRANREAILQPNYRNAAVLPICETFDKIALDSLLATTGCSFVRIYFGMDDSLKIHAIIVTADAAGNDLLPSSNPVSFTHDYEILDRGIRCPELCPPASVLNS
jgi:hypothetical protein